MSSCRLVLGFRIGETSFFLCAKSAGLLFQPLTSMGKPHRIVPVFHFLSCTSFCRLHRQLSYRCCGRSTLCIVANHALILEADLPISTLRHCTRSFEQAVVNATPENRQTAIKVIDAPFGSDWHEAKQHQRTIRNHRLLRKVGRSMIQCRKKAAIYRTTIPNSYGFISTDLTFASCINGVVSTQPILHGVISNHLILFFIQREWFQIPPLAAKATLKPSNHFLYRCAVATHLVTFEKGVVSNDTLCRLPCLMYQMSIPSVSYSMP